MNSGEPTLIVPQEWVLGPVGESVVIAWNASREATRAVHDALPILKKARKVVVFAFSQKQSALRASADGARRTPRAPRRLGDRFRLDQHRRDLGHRGVVRQSRHPGLRPHRRRRLRPFENFRGPFRRRQPRSAPAALAAGADVALGRQSAVGSTGRRIAPTARLPQRGHPMMLAMVAREKGAPLVLEERHDLSPGPNDVLIRVEACGVCRTDLHVDRRRARQSPLSDHPRA